MKAENNFLAFFISLLQREVRNLSAKSASGKLQFQLPGSLHRRKYLENVGVRLTGTTVGHQLPPPAQCKPELPPGICSAEGLIPSHNVTNTAKGCDCWMNWNTSLRTTWLKEFSIWRAQVMEELKAWAEPLQLLMMPGLGWIPAPLPGNGRCLTSVLFPWQNAFFWVSPQSSVWGVVLERLDRTGFSALFSFQSVAMRKGRKGIKCPDLELIPWDMPFQQPSTKSVLFFCRRKRLIIGAEGQGDQAITSVSEAAQRDWRRVLQLS